MIVGRPNSRSEGQLLCEDWSDSITTERHSENCNHVFYLFVDPPLG